MDAGSVQISLYAGNRMLSQQAVQKEDLGDSVTLGELLERLDTSGTSSSACEVRLHCSAVCWRRPRAGACSGMHEGCFTHQHMDPLQLCTATRPIADSTGEPAGPRVWRLANAGGLTPLYTVHASLPMVCVPYNNMPWVCVWWVGWGGGGALA